MAFGRRLEGLRAGNPDRLESELMHMERKLRHGRLVEVKAIAPVLENGI